MTFRTLPLFSPRSPASRAGRVCRVGGALVPKPGFSGHESVPAAWQKSRKDKTLKAVPADSRPPPVVEVRGRRGRPVSTRLPLLSRRGQKVPRFARDDNHSGFDVTHQFETSCHPERSEGSLRLATGRSRQEWA